MLSNTSIMILSPLASLSLCHLSLSGKWYSKISSYIRSIMLLITNQIIPLSYSPLSLCFSNSNSNGLIGSLLTGSSSSIWRSLKYSCFSASLTVILFLGSNTRSLFNKSSAIEFESVNTFSKDFDFFFLHFFTKFRH